MSGRLAQKILQLSSDERPLLLDVAANPLFRSLLQDEITELRLELSNLLIPDDPALESKFVATYRRVRQDQDALMQLAQAFDSIVENVSQTENGNVR